MKEREEEWLLNDTLGYQYQTNLRFYDRKVIVKTCYNRETRVDADKKCRRWWVCWWRSVTP